MIKQCIQYDFISEHTRTTLIGWATLRDDSSSSSDYDDYLSSNASNSNQILLDYCDYYSMQYWIALLEYEDKLIDTRVLYDSHNLISFTNLDITLHNVNNNNKKVTITIQGQTKDIEDMLHECYINLDSLNVV